MTTRITLFGDSYIEHLDSLIEQFNINTLTVSDIGYLLIKYKFILVYFYFNCSHGNLFDNFSEINDRPRREKNLFWGLRTTKAQTSLRIHTV